MTCFSALQRAEIAEIVHLICRLHRLALVSVLFNEPKLLKSSVGTGVSIEVEVSVLFNEPKLLKSTRRTLKQ